MKHLDPIVPGRMFAGLGPHAARPEALLRLAATMVDKDERLSADSDIPAGYTYFGQFVDHDITFVAGLLSGRRAGPSTPSDCLAPRLELDSLYGEGPESSDRLYQDGRGPKLAVGETDIGRPLDLPRLPNGTALIGNRRNDENLAVSQMHFAWIRFHNRIVDRICERGVGNAAGDVFAEARQTAVWHYQWIVLHDFLPRIVRRQVLDDVLRNGRRFYMPAGAAAVPVEFSVAAYRMGHSMVRSRYEWSHNHRDAELEKLFRFSAVFGALRKQSDEWVADWRRMFEIEMPDGFVVNRARTIDPLLAGELHQLPKGGGSLAGRTLLRGLAIGLPSGQAVAAAIGVDPQDQVTPEEFTGPDGAAARADGFDTSTPLWYYILKEAQVREGGQRLGAVGSRIVAEVFVGLLELDPLSFLASEPAWSPTLPSSKPGHFTMTDMLRVAGNVNPLVDG